MLNNLFPYPAKKLIKRTADYLLHDTVKPKVGSVLHCRLPAVAEHTGIYVGNGKVIELNGKGNIVKIPLSKFTGDFTPRIGILIYVACDENEKVLYSNTISDRAFKKVGSKRDYNLLLDNCHQFTCGAITGEFENKNNYFWMVERCIKKHYSVKKVKWRAIHSDLY